MKKFFSAKEIMQDNGLFFIRIVVGLFLVYHGSEIFDAAKMKEFAAWDVFKKSSSASYLVYLGKGAELAGGILLAAGLLTRLACILIIGTMLYISFFIGSGKIWFEDQYPFLFALLALVFFFTGPGNKSIDHLLFDKQKRKI
jgi:putative oxidoreductase